MAPAQITYFQEGSSCGDRWRWSGIRLEGCGHQPCGPAGPQSKGPTQGHGGGDVEKAPGVILRETQVLQANHTLILETTYFWKVVSDEKSPPPTAAGVSPQME